MLTLDSIDAFDRFLAGHGAALVWFGGGDCGVCRVLEPKVAALLAERFPRIAPARVEAQALPELCGQQRVLSLPTAVIYFEGRELLRKVRNFSPGELGEALARPYQLFFD